MIDSPDRPEPQPPDDSRRHWNVIARLPAFLLVISGHGHGQDWGPPLYPPVR